MWACYLNHTNHHHTYNVLCPAKQTSRSTDNDWLTHDEPQTQEWTTHRLLSSLQQATTLLPWTPVFRESIPHQLGLSGPALPKFRHLSGARLLGWLACDGFQTLLVLMMLSAGQQKGHPSSWRVLLLRRDRSSWMVRVREWMQVCAASWNWGSTRWWQVPFARVAYVTSINDGA